MQYEVDIDLPTLLIRCEEYVEQRGFGEDTFKLLKDESKIVFKQYVNSDKFIIDKLVSFVKRQELKNAISKSISILENDGNPEEVLKLVDKAVSIGAGSANDGHTYNDLKNLPVLYRNSYNTKNLVKTGFSQYDDALSGGFAPGELHVIIGVPKSGKSTFACNIGTHPLISGKVVFHISLEIKAIDVLAKYALRLTGMTYKELLNSNTEDFNKKLEKFDKYKPNLFVNYWTEGTATTHHIRSWICKKRAETGLTPDLIIVDYDDLLVSLHGGDDPDNLYSTSGNIYGDLIGLADFFKCFTGDTLIPLADGTCRRLDSIDPGEEIFIYCIDDKGNTSIEPAYGLPPITNTEDLVEVTLDNGEAERCTPEHLWMMRDGSYKEAQELAEGDSMMPMYKELENLKVKSVRTIPRDGDEVYCINVPKSGNFLLKSGVIVHNCGVLTFSQPKREAWCKPDEGNVIVSADISHSAKKIHKAFSISSLNFPRGSTEGVLYVDLVRRGESDKKVAMVRDLTRAYFAEK